MEKRFLFSLLVEFGKCFLIRIFLNVWFHKEDFSVELSNWHKGSSVSKWNKSGQTEADWQWNAVEGESQPSLRQEMPF